MTVLLVEVGRGNRRHILLQLPLDSKVLGAHVQGTRPERNPTELLPGFFLGPSGDLPTLASLSIPSATVAEVELLRERKMAKTVYVSYSIGRVDNRCEAYVTFSSEEWTSRSVQDLRERIWKRLEDLFVTFLGVLGRYSFQL